MFINRDYRRTEEDDFKLNVLSRMGLDSEAVPVYGPLDPMKHSASIPVLEEPEPSKPFVQLTGEDGNVFSIIGRVSGALKKAGQADKAKEFSTKAMHSGSYDEVLQLAMTYCDVG